MSNHRFGTPATGWGRRSGDGSGFVQQPIHVVIHAPFAPPPLPDRPEVVIHNHTTVVQPDRANEPDPGVKCASTPMYPETGGPSGVGQLVVALAYGFLIGRAAAALGRRHPAVATVLVSALVAIFPATLVAVALAVVVVLVSPNSNGSVAQAICEVPAALTYIWTTIRLARRGRK